MTLTAQTANLRYHERLKRVLPGGVHYNFNMPWEEVPLHFVDGKGSRLTDMDGNEYLDLYARFGAMILGHAHEEYLDALQEAMGRVLCVSHCDFDADPLELMNAHIPSAEMIRFGLSGTEILQTALRLARAHTKRNRFLRFENHYHGNADNIMGGRVTDRRHPVPVDFRGDYKGTAGRAANVMADQSYMLPWNDVERLEDFFREHGETLACAVTEPVCVNGGSIEAAPGYLERLRELCTEYGTVLIFDEMITGVRMGVGGAQKRLGVTPDLTTFGKAIGGGGVPVSALVGKREIMALLESKKVVHAGTYNGYPLGSAAVKATFEILSRDDEAVLHAMHRRAAELQSILVAEAAAAGLPLIVQGPPGVASFHCTDTPLEHPGQYDFDLMSKDIIVATALQRHGVLISSISRIYPNAQLSDLDLEYFQVHARKALGEAERSIAEIF
ncbi:aspartate aminotransferase family protein [Glycomyces paridis]|uniref:Aminotransferase class III-fold pyridoxal phosphate-dependent enzyme n=1 Tax=Glycomyces paridis TaxID=2126555 RepID=A0A4S8P9X4_9ACTN|nr:aminotransferase class III-fold pyridoxal phosphate-dependent enzyme [Glycomyces paridis]THV24619.1 aminotransferase class III-fold pyridoxal phosphate-dependent enzyme [Glycomyces paridis]